MAVLPLRFDWEDNNGRRAQQTFHLRDPASIAGMLPVADSLYNVLTALSSARLYRAYVTVPLTLSVVTTAAPESDVYDRLVLLFREGQQYGSFTVPSPRVLPFDLAGPYRAIRITREALQVSGVLPLVESAVQGIVRADGLPFPGLFSVGGRTREP